MNPALVNAVLADLGVYSNGQRESRMPEPIKAPSLEFKPNRRHDGLMSWTVLLRGEPVGTASQGLFVAYAGQWLTQEHLEQVVEFIKEWKREQHNNRTA
jgi:hypothetical protein